MVNLHNGHIFNGHGRVGYARCVYGAALIPEPIAMPTDVPYHASLGPASATTTLILYCQYDYPCNKLRPILQQLLAERSIRIEWTDWALWDTLEHYSLASCAAARQGSFAAMHQQLWQAAKNKVDAAGVRRVADKLGLDLARFDADSRPLPHGPRGARPAGPKPRPARNAHAHHRRDPPQSPVAARRARAGHRAAARVGDPA